MEQELMLGGKPVGKVQVLRQGLYYAFHCRCRVSGETAVRLLARCGERREDLGVLVPMEGGFGLDTRRPVKHLGDGEIQFLLASKHDPPQTHFAPISPEEPFAYLQRLKDAYLETRNGQKGAAWRE